MTRYVQAADGRVLAFDVHGDPHGEPIFLFHGTPGSRSGPRPRGIHLDHMGVCLISYDRPGYGESERRVGRDVAHAADDVMAIAKALEIDQFAVLGRSGGGPHALACAAKLSGHVTRAAALVSLAPRDAKGLDWFEGMTESNVREFKAAWRAADGQPDDEDYRILAELVSRNTSALATSATNFLQSFLASMMPAHDRRVIADPGLRQSIVDTYLYAVANENNLSPSHPDAPVNGNGRAEKMLVGWFDDALALGKDWGFNLKDIKVPVLIWHGDEDVFSPVSHSKWLAEHIKDSHLVVEEGSAHFRAMELLPYALQWLRGAKARPLTKAKS